MFLPTERKYVCIWLLIQLCNTAENKRYKKLPGYILGPSTLLWTDDVSRSLTQCLVICKQTEHCYAISMTSSTGYCAYHNWLLENGIPIVMKDGTYDDIMILVKPITALHMANNNRFSYTDAQTFCKSIGGRITSYSEIYAAWQIGYELCSCGWFDDQTAGFPMQTADPNCSNGVGIMKCDWGDQWSVYCSTN